jgi:hypothetical protein
VRLARRSPQARMSLSSRQSGSCGSTNLTAKPSSRWRNTRPTRLPTASGVPISRLDVGRNRNAGNRHVDDKEFQHAAVGENQFGVRILRRDALVPPVLGEIVILVLLVPVDLDREFPALVVGRRDLHDEAALEQANDHVFQLANSLLKTMTRSPMAPFTGTISVIARNEMLTMRQANSRRLP